MPEEEQEAEGSRNRGGKEASPGRRNQGACSSVVAVDIRRVVKRFIPDPSAICLTGGVPEVVGCRRHR